MSRWLSRVRIRHLSTAGLFLLILVLTPWLAACGPTPTPETGESGVVIVTATPSPEQVIQVVTATFTPPSGVQVVTATFTPESAAPGDTQAPPPTYTPYPTYTPLPTFTTAPADTPIPPTNTPPPAPTKPPKPKATNTPVPQAYPPPSLMSPAPNFNCWTARRCDFVWSWGGSLKANEYFQVQLIGPNNEHRGIHPPTKGYTFTSDETVYLIVPDWCNVNYFCNVKWTVAIIQWDGVDPSKIGRTIVEGEWRDVTL